MPKIEVQKVDKKKDSEIHLKIKLIHRDFQFNMFNILILRILKIKINTSLQNMIVPGNKAKLIMSLEISA